MHRLKDEIIFAIGPKLFDESPARRLRPQAVFEQFIGIRPPLPEIVVDIDDRNACPTRPLFEAPETGRHREVLAKYALSVRKLEMIDRIDDDEGETGFMADVACWHDNTLS